MACTGKCLRAFATQRELARPRELTRRQAARRRIAPAACARAIDHAAVRLARRDQRRATDGRDLVQQCGYGAAPTLDRTLGDHTVVKSSDGQLLHATERGYVALPARIVAPAMHA